MRGPVLGILVVVFITLGRPAEAQVDPSWELAATASEGAARGESQWSSYPGWAIELSKGFDAKFAIVGTVSCNYHSNTFGNGRRYSDSIYGLLGGVRVKGRRQGRVMPFGEILAGTDHFIATLDSVPEYTNTLFAIQPAGGVDLALSPALGIRAFASERIDSPWFLAGWRYGLWNVGGGIVYRFGR